MKHNDAAEIIRQELLRPHDKRIYEFAANVAPSYPDTEEGRKRFRETVRRHFRSIGLIPEPYEE